jgi:hypothetical protein
MNGLEKNLFEMYKQVINGAHCKACYERDKSEKRNRNPPASFWNLGDYFADKTKPRIAFVGKSMWLTRENLERDCERIEPVYDIRFLAPEFYVPPSRGYRYWKCIKNVSDKVYSTEKDGLDFLKNIFITNLVKCNVVGNNYRDKTDFEYYKNCIDIFEKEIEIVAPSHVIFFTGDSFDSLMEKLRFGYGESDWKDCSSKDCIRQITARKKVKRKSVHWWHRTFYRDGRPSMHFLRTNHPQGTPEEFDSEIVNWIWGTYT